MNQGLGSQRYCGAQVEPAGTFAVCRQFTFRETSFQYLDLLGIAQKLLIAKYPIPTVFRNESSQETSIPDNNPKSPEGIGNNRDSEGGDSLAFVGRIVCS